MTFVPRRYLKKIFRKFGVAFVSGGRGSRSFFQTFQQTTFDLQARFTEPLNNIFQGRRAAFYWDFHPDVRVVMVITTHALS